MRKLKAFYRRNYNLFNFIVDLLILTFIVLLIILILSLAKDLKTLKSNREKWGRSESIGLRCGGLAKTKDTGLVGQNNEIKEKWQGYVSYYSRSGCLGCNKDLRTASGEILSDTDFTLAFNRLPMGTMVKITNLRNNKSVVSKVNDTGGFESLGRIADLNLATKNEIEAKTDSDLIVIEEL